MNAEKIWTLLLNARDKGMTSDELAPHVGAEPSEVVEILSRTDSAKRRRADLPGSKFWATTLKVDDSYTRPVGSTKEEDEIYSLFPLSRNAAFIAAGSRGLTLDEWSFVCNPEPTGETRDGKDVLAKPTRETLKPVVENLVRSGVVILSAGRYSIKPAPAPVTHTDPHAPISAQAALAKSDVYLSVIPRSAEGAATDRGIQAALAKFGTRRTIVAVRVRLDTLVALGEVRVIGEKWSRENPRRYYIGKEAVCLHCPQHCPPPRAGERTS